MIIFLKQKNILHVVQGHDHPALLKPNLSAGDLSWIADDAPSITSNYGAKTRYRQHDAACHIDEIDLETCDVSFEQPQWAVTPGQSVVLYDRDVCLGGGIIQ